MCMSGLPLKVFIVDKSSCFRNASLHLGFKPLKYSEDKLPRTAFRIQYKIRLFFFFKSV